MISAILLLFFLFPLAGDGQNTVVERYVHMLFLQPRQLCLNNVFLLRFLYVHRRCPATSGEQLIVAVIAPDEHVEQRIYPIAQMIEFP